MVLHGLSENESAFDRQRDQVGTTYAETLADLGWTPVLLRANTGLGLRENGVALAALLRDLVDAWPVGVDAARPGRALDGRADLRAACAVATDASSRGPAWSPTSSPSGPRTSAPRWPGESATAPRRSRRLPETAAFGRILDQRSVGVHDLVDGLGDDVPPLPHARYHLVSATLTPLAAPPGRPVPRATCWCASRRRTAAPDGIPGCSPAPTRCTCRGPGTSTCSTIPTSTRPCASGWPETGPGDAESAVGEQGPRHAWKRRPMRLGSQT